MSGKRTRASNYTDVEVNKLLNLVYDYKHIIECKKTDHASNKEKDNCWQELSTIFNNSCNSTRSKDNLKSKWESLKKLVRKEINVIKNSQKTAGDGPDIKTELTTIQNKVLLIIGVTGIGHASQFGCDKEELNVVLENVDCGDEDTVTTSNERDVSSYIWKDWNPTTLRKKQDVHLDNMGESYSLVSVEEILYNESSDLDKLVQESQTQAKETPPYCPKKNTEEQIYSNLPCTQKSLLQLQINCTQKEFEKKQELMNVQIAIAEEERKITALKRKKIDLEILLLEEELKKARRN